MMTFSSRWALVALILIAGCSSTRHVHTEHDAPAVAVESPAVFEEPVIQALYTRDEEGTVVTEADVINWTSANLSDSIIIHRIDRCGVRFHLTAADENKLRDQGVSESVIQSMKATCRR